jgi:hypothetical protein
MRGAGIVLVLVAILLVTLAANASPRSERQAFAMFTRMWRSGFTDGFFRVSALGLRPDERVARPGAEPIVPESVRRQVPELPGVLRDLDAALGALHEREARLELALAEAARGDAAALESGNGHAGPAGHAALAAADGAPGATTRAILLQRRVALVADLRDALVAARDHRSDLTAARENLHLQMLRLRAGVGGAADVDQDVAEARRLLDVR